MIILLISFIYFEKDFFKNEIKKEIVLYGKNLQNLKNIQKNHSKQKRFSYFH